MYRVFGIGSFVVLSRVSFLESRCEGLGLADSVYWYRRCAIPHMCRFVS